MTVRSFLHSPAKIKILLQRAFPLTDGFRFLGIAGQQECGFRWKVCKMKEVGLSKMACLIVMFLITATVGASAQTFQTVITFSETNGAVPTAVLVQGTDGNFYGTTQYGGTSDLGTVFRLTPAGA